MAYLAHYGVKGMRWGVRRDRGGVEKLPPSHDHVRATELKTAAKTSGTQTLSNQEMRAVIERANLEQNYRRATAPPSAKVLAFVTNLIANQGKQQINQIANQQMTKAVKNAMAT